LQKIQILICSDPAILLLETMPLDWNLTMVSLIRRYWPSPRKGSLAGRYRLLGAGFSALTILSAQAAMGQTNLIANGSFAITGGSQSFQFGTYNSYTPSGSAAGESLTGWASTSFGFVFTPTTAIATGTYGNLSLYSATTTPSNSFNNAGPTGGNFIAEDSAYGTSPITQTVGGLVFGKTYTLSFFWAGAQQTGYTGATTDQWQVTLGSSGTQSTAVVNDVSTGFTGWMHQTMNFVATSASEQLSFLAVGTPAGVPPFALLSNVSLVQAPEPAGAATMALGIVGLIGLSWRRRRSLPVRR
jgi:hypothetical protein